MDTPRHSRNSSVFLQDMIKEKRSQTQRPSKSRDADGSAPYDTHTREVQSSPLGPSRERPRMHTRRASGMTARGQNAPKEMGLREMQEHISKINKQNFDLKLQIFHQRQRCETLEAKVEKLEGLEPENEELRAANGDLALQVEKGDADMEVRETAIEEAVGMICELEAKVEDLEHDLANYRSIVDAEVAPTPPAHKQLELSSTPPDGIQPTPSIKRSTSQSRRTILKSMASAASVPKSPLRPPSFLHDEKKSNSALRSLYSSGSPSVTSFHRASSVFSEEELEEELERQMLASPRLSILSESGFSSIYGHKTESNAGPSQDHEGLSNDTTITPNGSNEERAAQRKARIHDWVEESQRQEAPKTPKHQPSCQKSNARFSSISEVLEKTPSAPSQAIEASASPRSRNSVSTSVKQGSDKSSTDTRSPTKSLRKSAKAHEKFSPPGSVFGSNHLPPTPDTMSTATINRNSSSQSIITEKSPADGSLVPTNGYDSLAGKGRPQSSDSRHAYRLSNGDVTKNAGLEPSADEIASTQVEQDEAAVGFQGFTLSGDTAFMPGSITATRFFGTESPRRPALNTHVTDMMFDGNGYSPKHALRNASYPSPPRATPLGSTTQSPTSRRGSGIASDKTVISPQRPRSSHTRTRSSNSPSKPSAEAQDDFVAKPRNASSSLRFRLPKQSTSNNQSVTSRIFKRNKPLSSLASADASSTSTQETPAPPASSRPRLGRPASIHVPSSSVARPGTADGTHDPGPSLSLTRNSADERGARWKIMRRHSAVLDGGSIPTIDKDENSGLRRVTESRTSVRAAGVEEGKKWGAKLRDGLGFNRR